MTYKKNLMKPYNDAANDAQKHFLNSVHRGELYAVTSYLNQNPHAVNQPEKLTGWTALILAARNGDNKMIDLLLARGAKMDEKDKSGFTAMLAAAHNGKFDTAAKLVNRGADITVRDKTCRDAASYADQFGKRDALIRLVIPQAIKAALKSHF
jgi:uncharacterized protein